MKHKKEIFEKTYLEHRDKIFRLCYSYVGNENEAQDLLQECFVKVWLHLPKFKNRSKISTWIYRIGVNTCLMYLRKSKLSNISLNDSLHDTLVDDDIDNIEERSSALYKVIDRLPDIDRIIISMVLEDLPYREIADVLAISENNVSVKVFRIKEKLKSLIEQRH